MYHQQVMINITPNYVLLLHSEMYQSVTTAGIIYNIFASVSHKSKTRADGGRLKITNTHSVSCNNKNSWLSCSKFLLYITSTRKRKLNISGDVCRHSTGVCSKGTGIHW
ncbi:hypothetical protein NP493_331g05040 [Ridgeia piscesae]|uniref:Uncharacterized protein n=1 Tax=Ridgeia piscesae TaxID=27915 RepID=A0AAD9L4F5_RIDPI|nr:hypothetical protein NP493_331g05040 [Ridgeia piscesae]